MQRIPAARLFVLLAAATASGAAETGPGTPAFPHQLVAATSAERIESDIRKLVSFGTRHTLSETGSPTRGIGAARRRLA